MLDSMNITSLSRAASLLLLLPILAPLPGNSAPVSAERIVFPAKMAVRIIRDFGAKGDGRTDDTEVAFRANANYILDKDIRIHGSVTRLQGASSYLPPIKPNAPVTIAIEKQGGSPVVFDGMDRPLGKYLLQIETCGGRDVFIRRLRGNLFAKGAGNVFLQDSVSAVHISHPEAKVWAWQLNSESAEGVNVVNDGGQLWVLGLKTERNQVLIETKSDGRTEVLGGWIYNTVRTDPAPKRRAFSSPTLCRRSTPVLS